MINYVKIKIKKLQFDINCIITSMVLSFFIISNYNPLCNISVKSFDRVLGNGLMNGIDITKRISNIQFYNFILTPTIFLCVYLLIYKIIGNNDEEEKKYIEFIENLSSITLMVMIMAYISKFSNINYNNIEVILPVSLILLAIGVLALHRWNIFADIMRFDLFKWSLCSSLPITLIILATLSRFNFNFVNSRFILLYNIVAIFLIITILLIKDKLNITVLKQSYIFIMIAPIMVSFSQEIINILNQYSIIFNHRLRLLLFIYFISILCAFVYYLFFKSKKIDNLEFCFEKYYYPLLILTFALIFIQMPLQSTVNTELFEQSNHGTAINELFHYGKIPIIETFDAHMLQNEIGNIIYGLLNNDYFGAMFIGYSLLPISYILYYSLFRKYFNRDLAFLLIVFFPIGSDNLFQIFPILPIGIIALLYAYNKPTYKGYVLYWISILISCLYKLDMGFSITFSTLGVWIFLFIVNREKVSLKKLFLSCIYVLILCFSVFLTVCYIKDISVINRIKEFLNLCQSNINWAYSEIGNPETFAYNICYFLIPQINIICIITIIYRIYKKKGENLNDKYIIVLILGLITIINFSRGIVRHSLNENKASYILSSTQLFISMLIYLYNRRKRIINFVITYGGFTILISAIMFMNNISTQTIIGGAISRYLDFNLYNQTESQKVERVLLSDDMKQVYVPLKNILDKTLLPNETYIDFTNQTFLYPLVQRQKPVYVNQSPGLLSGEYTQEEFIKQCESMSEKIPFVLMPIEDRPFSRSLDGIENSYRYYLVSEYISNNFRPLFKNSKFAIWCRNEQYEKKYKILKDLLDNNAMETTFNEENLNKLYSENASLSIDNNELFIKSKNADPMVLGLENIIRSDNITAKDKLLKISIEYESDRDGLYELFYTTEQNENFSQEKVESKVMPNKGKFEAIIPYGEDSHIRFDVPEESRVKIKKITYRSVNKDFDDIELIDYNYIPLEYHTYNLMDIPYIWANYDDIKLYDKKTQFSLNNEESIYDFSSIDRSDGNYLCIDASADFDGSLTIQLGNTSQSEFTALTQFICSLKQGENQKYLVRISSDFMWYSGNVNSIRITSDNSAKINKISILKGDTIK